MSVFEDHTKLLGERHLSSKWDELLREVMFHTEDTSKNYQTLNDLTALNVSIANELEKKENNQKNTHAFLLEKLIAAMNNTTSGPLLSTKTLSSDTESSSKDEETMYFKHGETQDLYSLVAQRIIEFDGNMEITWNFYQHGMFTQTGENNVQFSGDCVDIATKQNVSPFTILIILFINKVTGKTLFESLI